MEERIADTIVILSFLRYQLGKSLQNKIIFDRAVK